MNSIMLRDINYTNAEQQEEIDVHMSNSRDERRHVDDDNGNRLCCPPDRFSQELQAELKLEWDFDTSEASWFSLGLLVDKILVGDYDGLKEILDRGSAFTEKELKIAFRVAFLKESANVVSLFLHCGANISWIFHGQKNAFHIISKNSFSMEVLTLFCDLLTGPVKHLLNERDADRCTPLYYAVKSNNPAFIRKLVESGAEVDKGSNDDVSVGIYEKIYQRERSLSIIRKIVEHGYETTEDFRGRAPLTVAVHGDMLACAEALIEKGASIFEYYRPHLHMTCIRPCRGHASSCVVLLQESETIENLRACEDCRFKEDKISTSLNILEEACKHKSIEVIKFLLSMPHAILLMKESEDNVALICIRKNFPEGLKLILEFGLIIGTSSTYNLYRETIMKGSVDLLQLLDKHGLRKSFRCNQLNVVSLIRMSCLMEPDDACLKYVLESCKKDAFGSLVEEYFTQQETKVELNGALFNSCCFAKLSKVLLLLSYGAEANFADSRPNKVFLVEYLKLFRRRRSNDIGYCRILKELLNKGKCQEQVSDAFESAVRLAIPMAAKMLYAAAAPVNLPTANEIVATTRRYGTGRHSQDDPGSPARVSAVATLLSSWAMHMPTLQEFCRTAIRKSITCDLAYATSQLPLPTILAQWLMIPEFDAIITESIAGSSFIIPSSYLQKVEAYASH